MKQADFPHKNLMFDFIENERMTDVPHGQRIIEAYRKFGFWTAHNDFWCGLGLLARL